MVRIRFWYDFSDNANFELSYWVEALKARDNLTWKYLWWKMDFKKQLIDALEKKWVADLPDLTLLINKIDERCDDFDPMQFVNSELCIEKLMKMSKELKKKKDKLTEKTQKNVCNSDTIMLVIFFCLFVIFCLIFLTEATNLCKY